MRLTVLCVGLCAFDCVTCRTGCALLTELRVELGTFENCVSEFYLCFVSVACTSRWK